MLDPLAPAYGLTAVLRGSLTTFDRSTSAKRFGSGRILDQRQELRQPLRRRRELAPRKAGRYHRRNCPGRSLAPIEACRKADGLLFVLDVT